jgi:hypothetical protein
MFPEVANALEEFIWRETHQFMAAQADKQIQSGLDGDGLDNFAKQAFHLLEHDDESAVRKQVKRDMYDIMTISLTSSVRRPELGRHNHFRGAFPVGDAQLRFPTIVAIDWRGGQNE